MNTSSALKDAKDLASQAPRSPRERIHGYVIMARMIDKGRAELNSTLGDYHFNCALDNMLFEFKGVKGEDVREVLASGASDEEVAAWIERHGKHKSSEEIEAWSDSKEGLSFYHDPEKKEWFVAECTRLGLDPVRTTLFEYLDEDDRATFGGL